jgi:hypothetical protein
VGPRPICRREWELRLRYKVCLHAYRWARQQQESLYGDPDCNGPGDRRYQFDPKNANELVEAERRFKELIGNGFTAATRTTAGETTKVAFFDPTAQETVFFPRLVGG